MKRDAKQQLLSLNLPELTAKLRELEKALLQARQEKFMNDRRQVDVKNSAKIATQIKMIKAELTRRQREGQE